MPTMAELFANTRLVGPQEDTAPFITMGGEDAELLEEYAELRGKVFANFLQTMRDDERFYRLEFGDDLIPAEWKQRGFEATLPPTAYNAVEAATNHILTTPDILVAERPAVDDTVQEQAIAAMKASFLQFFWHQVFKQGDPLGHAKKDLIKYGKVVLKKVIDYDRMKFDEAAVGRRRFPWCVYQISPSQVFEKGDPYDPEGVYEAYETTRDRAEELFPEARGAWRNKKAQEKVRVLEYWEKPYGRSKGRRVIWIDDVRVLNKANPYHWVEALDDSGRSRFTGYVPYFIGDSGWGDGDMGAAPHERYVGMIRRIHSLLKTEARQLTSADAQLRISTFPLLKMTNIEEDDEHPIKIAPGAKVHVDDTQNIEAVAWPQLDPALFAIISRVHTYTNELAQFQTLSGIPQSGVDSATEADQNFRAASAKMAGPLAALKSVITRMNETAFQDVEHVLEMPVTVYGAADGAPGVVILRPEYIDGFYENYVELKTSDTAALDAANAVRWANLYQTFGLDKRFAMKMARIPNPQQRIAQRMQEDVWLDPRMHELRVAAAMQGQGGEYGQLLSMSVVQALLNGNAPGEGQAAVSGGGGFPGGPPDQPSARVDPAATPQTESQQAPRASGFERAAMARPDLALSG